MTPEDELERELRAALRRREPPRDMVAPVRARLARGPGAGRRRWTAGLALAAVVVLAALGGYQWRRQAVGRADAQRVARALGVAAAELDAVRSRVNQKTP